MRIYIENFNIKKIPYLQKYLSSMLTSTSIYIEIFTNESIYHVDDKHIYQLETKDGDVKIHHNYVNNITLITDESRFQKSNETYISGNQHAHTKIKKEMYKLNPQSKISFVIETAYNIENNVFLPNDVYFETEEVINIREIFNKQQIIEFLSLLN